MPEEKENIIQNFTIHYEDSTTDIVKAASWKKLDDVEALSLEILKSAYDVNFSLSALFRPSNLQFWDNAKKLASILPVAGKAEPGFDPERIDSMDELCRIFVSTSKYRRYETGSVWNNKELLEPSEICKVHHLNFIDLLVKSETAIQEAKTVKEAGAKPPTTTKTATQGRKTSQTSETK